MKSLDSTLAVQEESEESKFNFRTARHTRWSHFTKSEEPGVNDSIKIWSHSYVDLLPERDRWYPNGVKIVPVDISLKNPRTLAHWHMGDGNASAPKGRLEVKLHTNGLQRRMLNYYLENSKINWGFIVSFRIGENNQSWFCSIRTLLFSYRW